MSGGRGLPLPRRHLASSLTPACTSAGKWASASAAIWAGGPAARARRVPPRLRLSNPFATLGSQHSPASHVLPAAKRVRTPATDAWETLQLYLRWPERREYALIRPVVGRTPAERATQTGAAARSIARQADLFETAGFARLLGGEAPPQRLPEGTRDALLTLQGEYPAFNPHELATIVAVRCGRRLSHYTVTRVRDTGLVPSASGPPKDRARRRVAPAKATRRRWSGVRHRRQLPRAGRWASASGKAA